MKGSRPTQYRTHERRRKDFQSQFNYFCEHFEIPTSVRSELEAKLIAVSDTVSAQQKRLLCKAQIVLPATPAMIFGKSWNFKYSLMGSLKESGLWAKYTPKGRDILRKSLDRNGTTISVGNGRPKYPHYPLVTTYAQAIVIALRSSPKIKEPQSLYARAFPVSRSLGEDKIDNKKPGGPALLLLEAALILALPFNGAPSRAALEKWVTQLSFQG